MIEVIPLKYDTMSQCVFVQSNVFQQVVNKRRIAPDLLARIKDDMAWKAEGRE